MYKIKMLRNIKGTEDGYNINVYKKGEIYTVGESLYNGFINMGVCELDNPKEEKPKKRRTKKVSPVKENKAE